MPKLYPVGDKIIVKRSDPEDKVGSIVLPDGAKEKPRRGKVMAVGEGRRLPNGQLQPVDVKKGDTIYFQSYAGMEIQVDGEKLLVMKEEDVLAVVEKE